MNDRHSSFLSHHVAVRQGAHLPHWTADAATYSVCFRLADSLPQSVLRELKYERAGLLEKLKNENAEPTADDLMQVRWLFSERVESFLDAGHGECWLRTPAVAEMVAKTLHHFQGARYMLHAWCIMPNHVHALVQPSAGHALPSILKSWKGFSAKEANRILGRAGEFWQVEYYDHLIRDEADYVHALQYILENPAKAGLQNWPWSGTGLPTRVDPADGERPHNI